ncbi:hypothetical protein MTO96_016752 [Rhipicephalus appendiculatus]
MQVEMGPSFVLDFVLCGRTGGERCSICSLEPANADRVGLMGGPAQRRHCLGSTDDQALSSTALRIGRPLSVGCAGAASASGFDAGLPAAGW